MTDSAPITERVRLRRFLPADRQFVLELHQSPDLRRFIPSAELSTAEDASGLPVASSAG